MNYKVLMLIPVILLAVSIAYTVYISFFSGINLSIDLKGGTQLTFDTDSYVSPQQIQKILGNVNVRIGKSTSGYSVIIDGNENYDANKAVQTLKSSGYNVKDFSIQKIGPSLGASFFSQAKFALILAFIFMSITVFLIFRKALPSFYVVLSAFSDIIEAFAFSQLFGIELSMASFAALLLLIGYSVDTDILLTTRILRSREGDIAEKMKKAMKTGLTMSATTLAALVALYFFSGTSVITQIASVLLLGLLFDVINTWLMNASLLKWYVERKKNV